MQRGTRGGRCRSSITAIYNIPHSSLFTEESGPRKHQMIYFGDEDSCRAEEGLDEGHVRLLPAVSGHLAQRPHIITCHVGSDHASFRPWLLHSSPPAPRCKGQRSKVRRFHSRTSSCFSPFLPKQRAETQPRGGDISVQVQPFQRATATHSLSTLGTRKTAQ